jgi:hypothetical protein
MSFESPFFRFGYSMDIHAAHPSDLAHVTKDGSSRGFGLRPLMPMKKL